MKTSSTEFEKNKISLIDIKQNFSVLISIYAGSNSKDLDQALLSIEEQTLLPSEVILVEDGYIDNSLTCIVKKYRLILNIISIRLKENMGHGYALNHGLKLCSNEIVIRMDGDDICLPKRFELQVDHLISNPGISVSSGRIDEFDSTVTNIIGSRSLPCKHEDIFKFAK